MANNYVVSSYDPLSVNLLIDSVPADQFADATFIDWYYSENLNDYEEGAKGDGTFTKRNTRKSMCKFRLKKNSTMHELLVGYAAADLTTAGGIPAFNVTLSENGTIIATGTMKIQTRARNSYQGSATGKDEPIREWTLVGTGVFLG